MKQTMKKFECLLVLGVGLGFQNRCQNQHSKSWYVYILFPSSEKRVSTYFYCIGSNCSGFNYNQWSNFSLYVLKSGRFLYLGFYCIRSNCSGFDYNKWSKFSLYVLKSGRLLYLGFYCIRSNCSGFNYNKWSNFSLYVLKKWKALIFGFLLY